MKIIDFNGVEVFRHKNEGVVWEVYNKDYNTGAGYRVISLGW